MKTTLKTTARLLALTATLAVSTAANAYFVRPYLQLGGGIIDGYVANGPTQSSQNFGTALQSHVDLSDGTVRSFLEVTGPSISGQSAGIFGDTLHFNTNAIGTALSFSFAVDGNIQSPAIDPNLDPFLQIGVSGNIAVYKASAGATYANFTSLPGALGRDNFFTQFNNPSTALSFNFAQVLNTSIILAATDLDLDIFVSMSTFTATNGNPVTVTMNFMNTGQFGIQAAPGVTFTSDSGVFLQALQQPANVPEPSSLALIGLALASVAVVSRRRKQPCG